MLVSIGAADGQRKAPMIDPLTLDQMRIFVAVAETGSFSAAARRLGRVQSAISQSVQSLESALGTPLFERNGKVPKLNDAGRVILQDARRVIDGAETLKARAEAIAEDVEPELTLAVEAVFPDAVLMQSLKAVRQEFPRLSVTLFTEGLGGAEQRLRDGVARLGLYVPFITLAPDHETEFLVDVLTVPVVAAGHPLAARGRLGRSDLEPEVQLILTDRTQITSGISGSIISHHVWRFADLGTRLEFLLEGFGWCYMPIHIVREHIIAGRLNVLDIETVKPPVLPIHVVHKRGRPPGRAGQWLIADIRRRLPACVGPMSLPQAQSPGAALPARPQGADAAAAG
jgi:DNA-binding transcriptional LysR family regulator